MDEAYSKFLASKAVRATQRGLLDIPFLPGALRPFQRDIVVWALRLGRAAIFAGTGLGKTIAQLSFSQAIADHVGRPIIILTPLAVAQQTVREAAKFGIESVAYAHDQSEASSAIVVTNYDRIEKFDLSQFCGIVLDESSIIKSHESATRRLLIELCQDIPFRLCCTATPAPNDYVELGNHAEFLGVLSQKEMLATWFVHDGSIRATNADNHGAKPIADWRLKRHAAKDFWRWVSSWAVMIRHPRDLGYEEEGYDLPPLIKCQVTVPVEYKPSVESGLLFPMEACTLSERIGARRDSIDVRVRKGVQIIDSNPDSEPWLIWCALNKEQEALERAFRDRAFSVYGSLDADEKARRIMGWIGGERQILLSKVSICGFGLNFQNCSRVIFIGLNDSFEQLFQAIRRCWRFGQTKPVTVYMIAAETEGAVVANLEAKERDAERMADAMAEHMRDLTARALHGHGLRIPASRSHTMKMEIPAWIT